MSEEREYRIVPYDEAVEPFTIMAANPIEAGKIAFEDFDVVGFRCVVISEWLDELREATPEVEPEIVEEVKEIGKEKKCEHCGETFIPNSASQKYCKRECNDEAQRQRRKRERAKKKLIPLEAKTCAYCDKEFIPSTRSSQKYCDKDCREAFNNAKREALKPKGTSKKRGASSKEPLAAQEAPTFISTPMIEERYEKAVRRIHEAISREIYELQREIEEINTTIIRLQDLENSLLDES